jgi:hypothetical protein
MIKCPATSSDRWLPACPTPPIQCHSLPLFVGRQSVPASLPPPPALSLPSPVTGSGFPITRSATFLLHLPSGTLPPVPLGRHHSWLVRSPSTARSSRPCTGRHRIRALHCWFRSARGPLKWVTPTSSFANETVAPLPPPCALPPPPEPSESPESLAGPARSRPGHHQCDPRCAGHHARTGSHRLSVPLCAPPRSPRSSLGLRPQRELLLGHHCLGTELLLGHPHPWRIHNLSEPPWTAGRYRCHLPVAAALASRLFFSHLGRLHHR